MNQTLIVMLRFIYYKLVRSSTVTEGICEFQKDEVASGFRHGWLHWRRPHYCQCKTTDVNITTHIVNGDQL